MSVIAIGSDHAGYKLKCAVIMHLNEQGYTIKDFGTDGFDSVDYPDYGYAVAKYVASNEDIKGIIICGTGIGISIAANKVKGIRAAVCTNTKMAELAREHNNANILALGARIIDEKEGLLIVDSFLKTNFLKDNPRHVRRVGKLVEFDNYL